MARIRRVDWSFDEWIAGTIGMTVEQEGLYCRVINRLYSSRDGEIPLSEAATICAVDPRLWRRLWATIAAKFEIYDGSIRHLRVISERSKAEIRLRSSVDNGSKGGRPSTYDNRAVPTRAESITSHHHHKKESSSLDGGLGAPAAPAPAPKPTAEARPKPNGHDKPTEAEKRRRKDLLVSKLYRFIKATMKGEEAEKAGMGLMAEDKAEAQRWLDKLSKQMKQAKWDDVTQ